MANVRRNDKLIAVPKDVRKIESKNRIDGNDSK